MLTKVPLTAKELIAVNLSVRTIVATEAAARSGIDVQFGFTDEERALFDEPDKALTSPPDTAR